MKSKEITSNKKMIIIFFITLLGMGLSLLINNIFNQPFLFDSNDRFMDYFNTLNISNKVYDGIGTGRGYFPFTYVLLNIIKFLIGRGHVSYFITVILTCIFIAVFYRTFFKKLDFWGIVITTLLSYPLIFEFDRGNIEHLVFIFILLFFTAYKKEKFNIAAILLAFPICMKLYPALFAILFLRDKKYKQFILCGIFSMLVIVASFILVGGNLNNLPIALENFSYFTNTISKTEYGIQFSHTIWSCLNYISLNINNSLLEASNMTIYTITIAIFALGLIGYIVFWEKDEWKAITILTIMMITFPHVSFDYTLIHLYIPIAFFINSKKTKKWEEIVYSILFSFTIIPMNWFQTVVKPTIVLYTGEIIMPNITLNLGLLIRPLILILIIVIIVITTIKNRKNLLEENFVK